MERYFDHKSGMTFISVAPLKVASKRAMQAKSKTGKRWIVVVSHQYRDAIGEQIVANYRERTVFIDKSRFDRFVAELRNQVRIPQKSLTTENNHDQ